jgi:ribosomal protein S12 methylthiotransferase accessory factor
MATVEVVGSGRAAESLVDALSEQTASIVRSDEPTSSAVDLSVVVAQTGADVFAAANDCIQGTDIPWVTVELGGIGGIECVSGAVAGFSSESGCYHCLRERVRANRESKPQAVETLTNSSHHLLGAIAGRRIDTVLSGSAPLAGTVVELPYTERRLLPIPGCSCTDTRSWTLTHEDTTHDSEAVERAEAGIDERLGIVQEIGEIESFPAPYYLASVASTERFSDVTAPQKAAGVAGDWDTAFMKALGESYERYAAGVYRTDTLVTGPPDAVERAIEPKAFVRPESWETPETCVWIPAENLQTGSRVHLPADTVLYPPPSETTRPATTTGLGLGSTESDALLSGIYEVIERDATMCAWYSTYEPLAISVDGVERFETLRRRATADGLTVQALLLTADIDVPVIAVAVTRDDWPRVALGSSARLNSAEAATGALSEALQNWMELRAMGRKQAADADGAIGRYAASPRSISSFVETDATVPLSDVGPDTVPSGRQELSMVIERLSAAGLDPFATRLTPPDVSQMGFETVRVVCPTAQPLFFDDSYFGNRAQEVPAEMGFQFRPDHNHHPFP